MNKLPWFSHDTDARRDFFIRQAVERFGHFGYAGYFMLLEVIQAHGRGDTIKAPARYLADELLTKPVRLMDFLDFAQKSGKIRYTKHGVEIEVTVPKFSSRNKNRRARFNPGTEVLGEAEGLRPIWDAFAEKHGLAPAPKEIRAGDLTAADLTAVLAEAATLPFLHGKNDRKWKITLGWLAYPENRAKVLERVTYEEHPRKGKAAPVADPYADAREEQAREEARKAAARKAAKAKPVPTPESELEDVPF